MTCGTCTYWRPKRDASGNELPRTAGDCTYSVIWPAIPRAYYRLYGAPTWPQKYTMFRGEGEGCEIYEKATK